MKTCPRTISKARRPVRFAKAAASALAAAWLLFGLLSPAAAAQDPATPLKALIVTGQNTNHDWKVSTAALKQMLEGTGLFEVDIAESPAPGAKMGGFEPKFASYKLVVLNYCGEMWPPSTRRAFSAYVKNGGGVVAYHAAAIAFAGWPEYNEIIGLGGWSNRNESFGPYAYWKDGAVALDPGPGIAGYHPQPFVYPVVHRDTTHPITAGLPEKWMHAEDELYSLLRGPAKNLTVLATARSGFENGGTGRDEPVLFTVSYGAGRIFHTVLGHAAGANPPGLECAGFITTFQRGAEWAATGKVTQQAPPDFPVTTRDVGTPEDVRLWPGFQPPTLEAILKDLATIEYSRDEAVLYRLREYVLAHNKSEASRAACEQELLAGLGAATQPYAVLALCRALRLVGSEDSVPALEKLLANEATTDAARYALEKIPGAAAEAALLRSLGATQGQVKTGIVSSLGQMRSPEAVDPLAALIFDPDAGLARAAVISLGRIGGAAGSAALAEAYGKAEGALKTELAYALLGSIDLQIADRDFSAALALADKLLAAPPEALPSALRQAAFKAKLLSLEKPEAARLVLETLARGPEEMRQPALGQVTKLYSEAEIGSGGLAPPQAPGAEPSPAHRRAGRLPEGCGARPGRRRPENRVHAGTPGRAQSPRQLRRRSDRPASRAARGGSQGGRTGGGPRGSRQDARKRHRRGHPLPAAGLAGRCPQERVHPGRRRAADPRGERSPRRRRPVGHAGELRSGRQGPEDGRRAGRYPGPARCPPRDRRRSRAGRDADDDRHHRPENT